MDKFVPNEPVVPGDRAILIRCDITEYLWQEVHVDSFYAGPAKFWPMGQTINVIDHMIISAPFFPSPPFGTQQFAAPRVDLMKISPDGGVIRGELNDSNDEVRENNKIIEKLKLEKQHGS